MDALSSMMIKTGDSLCIWDFLWWNSPEQETECVVRSEHWLSSSWSVPPVRSPKRWALNSTNADQLPESQRLSPTQHQRRSPASGFMIWVLKLICVCDLINMHRRDAAIVRPKPSAHPNSKAWYSGCPGSRAVYLYGIVVVVLISRKHERNGTRPRRSSTQPA